MRRMALKASVESNGFNLAAQLPYQLRQSDFQAAMEDVYDLLHDINVSQLDKGLRRIEETVRPAIFSGIMSDVLSASLAKHSRTLISNQFHNGHPDLIPEGRYPLDRVQSGDQGVEVKVTKGSGSVDAHGARPGWFCLFRYRCDNATEPVVARKPTEVIEILLAELTIEDFRTNNRGALGTRTSSPNRYGLDKLRHNWIYRRS